MTIDLTDPTTAAILEALGQARRRFGGPASGMVLTLIIVTDEAAQYDAVRAASEAGRGAPSRGGGPRAPEPGARRDHPQAQGRIPARRRDPGGRHRSRRDDPAPDVRAA